MIARAYAPGEAEGVALVLSEALSFWGGIDAQSGRIIDHSHPERGTVITGSVLVMPGGRGSSSSSSVLAETIRRGTGPAGIVLSIPDPILTVGALVAQALYGARCPIVVCPIDTIATGDRLRIRAGDTGSAQIDTIAPSGM
jgi:hypothetical protein